MSDTVTAALIAFGGVVIGYIFNMISVVFDALQLRAMLV